MYGTYSTSYYAYGASTVLVPVLELIVFVFDKNTNDSNRIQNLSVHVIDDDDSSISG